MTKLCYIRNVIDRHILSRHKNSLKSAVISFFYFTIPLFFSKAQAIEIGNPAQPYLQKKGVIFENPQNWSFRLAYFGDYIYRMQFKEEEIEFLVSSDIPTFGKLTTNAGIITLNLKNRCDIYAILGTSQLQLNRELYAKREFAWGIGGKMLIAKIAKIRFGLDLKFFTTVQKPLYFVSDGFAFDVLNEYQLGYYEIQGALGAAYQTKLISPYIHATYLISKLTPNTWTALVRLPWDTYATDADSKPFVGARRWGMAVGATLLSSSKASLTIESRFINQNAIDISGEFRF